MKIGVRIINAGLSVLLAFCLNACHDDASAVTDAEMNARIIGTWVMDDGPLSLYYMEKTYAPDGTATGFLVNRQTGKRIEFTSRWKIKDGYLSGEVSGASDPALLVGGNYLNKIVKMTDKRFIMVQEGTGRVTIKHRKGRFALFLMKIDILTLFPEICRAPLSESMMKRAQENKILELRIHNLRDWTTDKHHIVDDAPFGGGQGMVMKPEPIFAAVEELKSAKSKTILMSPAGKRLEQKLAADLSKESHLVVICGHYEGVDHRVIEHLVDLEISIGDYVLTNGAIAAAILVDAVVRLLPGALGDEQSAADDSFSIGSLESPHYTRPAEFRDWKVPEILLSGNHAEIAKWRKEQALKRTKQNRPDLLD